MTIDSVAAGATDPVAATATDPVAATATDPVAAKEPDPCPDLDTIEPSVLMHALCPFLTVGAQTEASLGMSTGFAQC